MLDLCQKKEVFPLLQRSMTFKLIYKTLKRCKDRYCSRKRVFTSCISVGCKCFHLVSQYLCVILANWVLETPFGAGNTTEEVLSILPAICLSVCGQICEHDRSTTLQVTVTIIGIKLKKNISRRGSSLKKVCVPHVQKLCPCCSGPGVKSDLWTFAACRPSPSLIPGVVVLGYTRALLRHCFSPI